MTVKLYDGGHGGLRTNKPVVMTMIFNRAALNISNKQEMDRVCFLARRTDSAYAVIC